MTHPSLLQLIPEYHHRVWGGQRLKASDPPVGEAWVVHECNRVASDRTRQDLGGSGAMELGAGLFGAPVVRARGCAASRC